MLLNFTYNVSNNVLIVYAQLGHTQLVNYNAHTHRVNVTVVWALNVCVCVGEEEDFADGSLIL